MPIRFKEGNQPYNVREEHMADFAKDHPDAYAILKDTSGKEWKVRASKYFKFQTDQMHLDPANPFPTSTIEDSPYKDEEQQAVQQMTQTATMPTSIPSVPSPLKKEEPEGGIPGVSDFKTFSEEHPMGMNFSSDAKVPFKAEEKLTTSYQDAIPAEELAMAKAGAALQAEYDKKAVQQIEDELADVNAKLAVMEEEYFNSADYLKYMAVSGAGRAVGSMLPGGTVGSALAFKDPFMFAPKELIDLQKKKTALMQAKEHKAVADEINKNNDYEGKSFRWDNIVTGAKQWGKETLRSFDPSYRSTELLFDKILIGNKVANGEELSAEEKDMLTVYALEDMMEQKYGSAKGDYGYIAGYGAPMMLEFMLQLAVSPGRGLAKASMTGAEKYAAKVTTNLIKKYGATAVRKNLLRAAAYTTKQTARLAGAGANSVIAANTSQAPALVEGVAERMAGKVIGERDEQGNVIGASFIDRKSPVRAIYEQGATMAIENFTEAMFEGLGVGKMVSGAMGKAGGKLAGTKLGQKLVSSKGASYMAELMENTSSTEWYKAFDKIRKAGHLGNAPEELLEEYAAIPLKHGMGVAETDMTMFEELTDPETFYSTAAGLSLGMGGMIMLQVAPASVSAGSDLIDYSRRKHFATSANKALHRADIGGASVFGEEWAYITPVIEAFTEEEIGNGMTQLINAQPTAEKKQAILNYMEALQEYRGANTMFEKMKRERIADDKKLAAIEARKEGYSMRNAQEIAAVKRRMEQMSSLYGQELEDIISQYAEPYDFLRAIEGKVSEGTLSIATEYINLKETYEGILDRMSDDTEARIQAMRNRVQSRTNKQAGNIITAQIADEQGNVATDEMGNPLSFYVVDADLTISDGAVSIPSEGSAIVRDFDGKMQMLPASRIVNPIAQSKEAVEALIAADEERIRAEEQMRNEAELSGADPVEVEGEAQEAASEEIAVQETPVPTRSAEQIAVELTKTESGQEVMELIDQYVRTEEDPEHVEQQIMAEYPEHAELAMEYYHSLTAPATEAPTTETPATEVSATEAPAVPTPHVIRNKDNDLDVDAMIANGVTPEQMAEVFVSEFDREDPGLALSTAQEYLAQVQEERAKTKSIIAKNGSLRKKEQFWSNVVGILTPQQEETPVTETPVTEAPVAEAPQAEAPQAEVPVEAQNANAKWQAAPKVYGRETTLRVKGMRLRGRYVVAPAGAATGSHTADFADNADFIHDEQGRSRNPRDYSQASNQATTQEIAGNFALQNMQIVSPDGIVYDGNGRQIAGDIAAQNGTDGAYLEDLMDRADEFGFTPEQIQSMEHPRVYFEVAPGQLDYSAQTFDKFNAPEMKAPSAVELGAAMGQVLSDETFNRLADTIKQSGGLAAVYKSKPLQEAIAYILRDASDVKDVTTATLPQYYNADTRTLTEAGRNLLEACLLGKIFADNPQVLALLPKLPNKVMSKVAQAMPELAANMQMGEYALKDELANALTLVYEASQSGASMNDYATQQDWTKGGSATDLFGKTVVMLAKALNGEIEGAELADVVRAYNVKVVDVVTGQGSMFENPTREQMLQEVINYYMKGEVATQEEAVATEESAPVTEESASQQEEAVAQPKTRVEKVNAMSDEEFNALLASNDLEAMRAYEQELHAMRGIDKAEREEYNRRSAKLAAIKAEFGEFENAPASVRSEYLKMSEEIEAKYSVDKVVERQDKLGTRIFEVEAQRAREEEQREKEEKENYRKTAFNGFLAEKTPMGAAKADKALNKQYRVDGKVGTVAGFIEAWNEEGPIELKVYENGKKNQYLVNGYDFGKTAYDYAQYLQSKKQQEMAEEETSPSLDSGISEKAESVSHEELVEQKKRGLSFYANRELTSLIKKIKDAIPHLQTRVERTEEGSEEGQEAEAELKKWGATLEAAESLLEEHKKGRWKNQFAVPLSESKELSIEDVKTLFESLNGDRAVGELFEKVYAVAKTLGLKIKISDQLSTAQGNAGNDGIVKYAASLFYLPFSDQDRASTLLHELIHTCTMYATGLHANRNNSRGITSLYDGLPQEIKDACAELEEIYNNIKKDKRVAGEYGIKSVNEMVAELSNPVFREKMKEISLWGKIVGAIKRLFGFEAFAPEGSEVSNALAEAERVLVKMLDNFDKSTYDAIRGKLQRSGRGRRNAVLGERLEVEAPQLNKYRAEKIFGGIWIGDKKEFAKFVTAVDNYAFEEDGEGIAYTDNFFYAYYLNIDGRVIPYASVYLNRYDSQDVVNLVNKEIGNVRQGERVKFYFDTAIARARAAKSKNNAYNGGNNSVPATTNNGRLGSGLLRKGGYYDHPDIYVKTQRADRFGLLDEEEEFLYHIEEKVISPDNQQIFDAAKEKFGTTLDMREAGYILPDGSMLDFSGKHEVRGADTSFLNGRRSVDHRDISAIAYDFDEEPTGVKTDMADFLDRGAIRIDYNAGAINLNVAPTKEQKDRLRRLIERNGGDVYVDFGKGWDTEHYVEYEGARAARVLADIDRYYSEGIKPEGTVLFRLREDAPPTKTGIGYKVFVLKDGKLYPPMVANPEGAETPVGVWLDADAAPVVGQSKTGRNQVKAGGKGTQGGSGTLAYRPGWHLGEIPYALQFNRKDENGERTLFPANFVWAEVEYANDVDYQEEAMSHGLNANGKFQHSLAGLPRLPENGAYKYRTNPNPETDPWIITGAMKVNRLLTPTEVDEMVREAGREPQRRQEGAITDEQITALNEQFVDEYRQGDGRYTDEELSILNDPMAKFAGESFRTKKQQKEYAERVRNHMRKKANELAEKLHLPVEVIESEEDMAKLQGKKAKAKGWYEVKSGKIVLVLPNNESVADIVETVLHEGVAHLGLRKLFGKQFTQFLDNVYNHAEQSIREKIDEIARKGKVSTRTATEEYLASLAETTDFENTDAKWWQQIKKFFLDMLHTIGFDYKGGTISDSELRYILWRSHENLKDGRYADVFSVAKDIALQNRLKAEEKQAKERRRILSLGKTDSNPLVTDSVNEEGLVYNLKKGIRISPQEYAQVSAIIQAYPNKSERGHVFTANNYYLCTDIDEEGNFKVVVAMPIEGNEELINEIRGENKYIAFKPLSRTESTAGVISRLRRQGKRLGRNLSAVEGQAGVDGRDDSVHLGQQANTGADQRSSDRNDGAVEEETLYRMGDANDQEDADNPEKLRQMYDKEMISAAFLSKETLVDHLASVEELLNIIAEKTGHKIPDTQNVYRRMLALSSRNKEQMDFFDYAVMPPLTRALNAILNEGKKRKIDWSSEEAEELIAYTIVKHGLERNRDMAVRQVISETLGGEGLDDWYSFVSEIRATPLTWKEKQMQMDAYALSKYGVDMTQEFSGLRDTLLTRGLIGEDSDMKKAVEEAYSFVESYEERIGEEKIKNLWAGVNLVSNWSLEKQRSSSLVSKAYVADCQRRYEFYVPLRGFNAKTAQDEYDYLDEVHYDMGNPVKKAEGRESMAGNPFANLMNIGYQSITSGNKNQALQAFWDLAQRSDVRGFLVPNRSWYLGKLKAEDIEIVRLALGGLAKISGESGEQVIPYIPEDASSAQISRILNEFEDAMKTLKEKGLATRRRAKAPTFPYRLLTPKQYGAHTVRVVINGEPRMVTVVGNPRVAQALTGKLNPDGAANRHLKAIQNFMAGAFTSRNIAFAVANLVRDSFSANRRAFVTEGMGYWGEMFRKQVFGTDDWKSLFNFVSWALPTNSLRTWALYIDYENRKGMTGRWSPVKRALAKLGNLGVNDAARERFKEFMENGGATGYTFSLTQAESLAKLAEMATTPKGKAKASGWNVLGVLFDGISAMSESSELVNRFIAYEVSRSRGRSIGHSISDAKEITLNFNRKGAGKKTLGKTGSTGSNRVDILAGISQYGKDYIVFWNANVQGINQMYQMATGHPLKWSVANMIVPYTLYAYVLPAINAGLASLYGIGGDDDENPYYDNLPDWVRQRNICILLPNGGWLTIPLDVTAQRFAAMGDVLGKAVTGKMTWTEAGGQIAQNVAALALPVEVNWGDDSQEAFERATSIGASFAPSILQTPMHIFANRDWKGKPLANRSSYNSKYPEYLRVYKDASPSLIAVSKIGNALFNPEADTYKRNTWLAEWNPHYMEEFINGYTGGWGSTTIAIIDALASASADIEEMPASKIPVVSRFYTDGSPEQLKRMAISDYHKVVKAYTDEINQRENLLEKALDEARKGTDDFAVAEADSALKRFQKGPEYLKFLKIKSDVKRIDKQRKRYGLENLPQETIDEINEVIGAITDEQ